MGDKRWDESMQELRQRPRGSMQGAVGWGASARAARDRVGGIGRKQELGRKAGA